MSGLPKLIAGGVGLVLMALAAERRRAEQAPQLALPSPNTEGSLVSILIPARNEERAIARCTRGALGQRYVHTEVIVLDDQSTDATGRILNSLAATDRLQVLTGTDLPAGWMGKCHACRQLADAAQGEWLLFLDADTAPGPDLVAAMLAHARRHKLDLLSVTPQLELESFGERLVLPVFFSMLTALYPLERMERPDARPGDVFASGWCFLVRRAAYEAIGGHAAVRDEVLEDVYLAQALRKAGYRIGGAEAGDQLRLRMYRSASEVAAGLGKNAAAGYQSGGLRSTLVMARMIGETFGPFWLGGAALFVRGAGAWPARGAALLGLGASLAHWGARYRTRYGLSRRHAPLWPLGLLAYLLIAANGMRKVWSGQGITWKGRRYQ
jgi:chlorobactene glucosyltransferase